MTMRRTHATNKMSRMYTIIHIIENAYQSVQVNYCYRLRYHTIPPDIGKWTALWADNSLELKEQVQHVQNITRRQYLSSSLFEYWNNEKEKHIL